MKKSMGISIITAAVTFFSLCLLFSGKPANAGFLASLDPVSAVCGLSFALSFAAGIPEMAAVVAAVTVFVVTPVAAFVIAHRIFRRYDG